MTIRLLSYLARQMLEAWLESLIFYWLMASKERKMLFLANCLSLALRERERKRKEREKNQKYILCERREVAFAAVRQ